MRGINRIAALACVALAALGGTAAAQELNCQVEVNSQSIQGTNKSVFETLQTAISEYFNDRKWTNAQLAPTEKIDCRFFPILRRSKPNGWNAASLVLFTLE